MVNAPSLQATSKPANYLPEHPFDNGALTIRDEQLAPFPRTKAAIKVHRAEYNAIVTHMDHEIGTLEAGKRADMVALARDPFSVEPIALRDIEVRGTVLGGVPFDAGC